MAHKVAYTTKANVNAVELWVGGKPIRVEAEKPYETSDPVEMAALDEHDGVKVDDGKDKDGK